MARIWLLVFLTTTAMSTFAQKFGYVDTNYILGRMPEYKEAQAEIEKLAKGWEQEIQAMYQEVQSMEANLKAEEVLLTVDMREERQSEIDRRWGEIKEQQKQIFGFEGLYFLKKKELIKPVQDKIFESVERVAKNNRLQIVFDKSGDLVMIYTDPIHDYTDYVLEELGLEQKQNSN
ncbi:MAG: OmpH family outer membrane protein [Cyclobacteriaceae bacterium]|nr:OmpH family outer membrane protein [Cyclobacteriaceae bacterium HetDA_MAG_MS6]